MPVQTVLNPYQKRRVFEALQKIAPEELHPALLAAALNNEQLPVEEKRFSTLCSLYVSEKIPEVKFHLHGAIRECYSKEIAGMIEKILVEVFDAEKWQTSFLGFVANKLNLKIQNEPLVQFTIKEGKIYWRIISGEDVVYDRARDKSHLPRCDFSKANTILMTWSQFRLFKDAGKRGGSVSITKTLFINAFPAPQKTIASEIWDELKAKHILDRNDRLSNAWRFASASEPITLKVTHIPYKQISTVLNQISSNRDNGEKIHGIPDAVIYRPERSPKDWASTGRVTNIEPKSPLHRVGPWDVSIYEDLRLHASSGDGLEHDHIPSTCVLKKKQDDLSLTGSQAEGKEKWSCIAIPKTLHKQGLSHGEGAKAQQKQIASPFIDEVNDYLDKLELEWRDKEVIGEEYLIALGAFRYMFRCQVSGKHAELSHRFFQENTQNIQRLDALFYARLEKFMVKREGFIPSVGS